ncbi:hypothetical protein BDZ45DRAFT_506090 [Acephala macrosclerotiorum]|nr:hypothetical protein BDZ45DRAFT_506090 [Acephala macrosclerotiorum]
MPDAPSMPSGNRQNRGGNGSARAQPVLATPSYLAAREAFEWFREDNTTRFTIRIPEGWMQYIFSADRYCAIEGSYGRSFQLRAAYITDSRDMIVYLAPTSAAQAALPPQSSVSRAYQVLAEYREALNLIRLQPNRDPPYIDNFMRTFHSAGYSKDLVLGNVAPLAVPPAVPPAGRPSVPRNSGEGRASGSSSRRQRVRVTGDVTGVLMTFESYRTLDRLRTRADARQELLQEIIGGLREQHFAEVVNNSNLRNLRRGRPSQGPGSGAV